MFAGDAGREHGQMLQTPGSPGKLSKLPGASTNRPRGVSNWGDLKAPPLPTNIAQYLADQLPLLSAAMYVGRRQVLSKQVTCSSGPFSFQTRAAQLMLLGTLAPSYPTILVFLASI